MAFETEEEIRAAREAAAAAETESRIRESRADETARAKEREEYGRAGQAHGQGDLFDFFLTSVANSIATQIREGNQAAERQIFEKERKEIVEQFKIEAARQVAEAKNIKELAKTSNDIDIAANKISKQLPESERSAFARDLQPINRDAQFRAERMERDEKIQERIKRARSKPQPLMAMPLRRSALSQVEPLRVSPLRASIAIAGTPGRRSGSQNVKPTRIASDRQSKRSCKDRG